MQLKIEKRDLFQVPDEYFFCHCISADFALGAGIAKKFADLGVRDELLEMGRGEHWHGRGYCIQTASPRPHGTYNLVTKEKYWHKPTLSTLRQALADMLDDDWLYESRAKIAMPKIGCGLDRLQWSDVEPLIREVFADTDFEILVCDWS